MWEKRVEPNSGTAHVASPLLQTNKQTNKNLSKFKLGLQTFRRIIYSVLDPTGPNILRPLKIATLIQSLFHKTTGSILECGLFKYGVKYSAY